MGTHFCVMPRVSLALKTSHVPWTVFSVDRAQLRDRQPVLDEAGNRFHSQNIRGCRDSILGHNWKLYLMIESDLGLLGP